MKFVKLSQNLKKYALNVRSVTLVYMHKSRGFLKKNVEIFHFSQLENHIENHADDLNIVRFFKFHD
jgi:hypothetical protein